MIKLAASFDGRFLFQSLIEKRLVAWHLCSKFPEGSNEDLTYACEWTPSRPLAPIQPGAGKESHNSHRHCHGWDAEAPAPANICLYPDKHRGGNESPDVNGEIKPVEERALLFLLGFIGIIKLVGAKG